MYFPVLTSRVLAQYPATRVTESQFQEAESAGGRLWRSASDSLPLVRWILRYEDLTDGEANVLAEFFEASAGGLRTFVFADPLGNLLRWSEDMEDPVWGKDAGIAISRLSGRADEPAEFQVRNGGANAARIWQELDLAPGLAVCFSCEMRGEGAVLRAPGGSSRVAGLAGEWTRVIVAGESLGGPQRVEVEIAAGATVFLRRLQVEAQVAPSEYQPTFEVGGIYPKARFAGGGLRLEAIAPDRHRADVVIESLMEGAE